MDSTTFKLVPIIALLLLLCLSASARIMLDSRPSSSTSTSLSARLKLEEESSSCWESLFQLQSCTAEVVLFFLNGETYLGAGCCRAIWIIQHHCWPQMLGSLGYTPQEAHILRGYCDATDHDALPPRPNS
ncbi:Egg cell-secreted protein 1.1 [Sesamum alatum]|uniref:Egg cell-secreted protein 1.1 n=1 Tax=Sesamum alatum TaxID=300844 RepID=A0AAE1YI03_9LAMI|nr:Egg cell-secreted protein 1.1 [Sesamum alatum]